MKKPLITALCCLGLSALVAPAYAQDADAAPCMDCHVPAEDWQGMTVDEILAKATDPAITRHEDNRALREDQLRQMIEALLAQ